MAVLRSTLQEDRRTFSFTTGDPFLVLADTAWSGLIRSTPSDWRDYLALRKTQGFNAVLTILTAPWRGAPVDAHGESALTPDNRVNASFFDRMEEKLAAARDADMLLLPVLIWACTPADPGQSWPEDRCIAVARHAVNRFANYSVVWLLGGDGNYAKDPARWTRIGRAVFKDHPNALVGMHYGGLQTPDPTLAAEPWCQLHGVQSGHGDGEQDFRFLQHTLPAAARTLSSRAALANLEPNYEHHPAYHSQMMFTARHVRRAAWWSMLLLPSCGVGYGHNSVWNWNTVPEGAVGHDTITDRVGKLPPWRDVIDLPGARSMGVLRTFFESLAWHALRPAPELLASQASLPELFVAAAESAPDRCAILYRPANAPLTLSPLALTRYRRMQWFDPRRGVLHPEGPIAPAPSPDSLPHPGDDWTLLLRP